MDILGNHLSPIIAKSILIHTFETEKIDPMRLAKSDLERIFQSSIFIGLRLYCKPKQLTAAMLELARMLED